MSYTDWFLNNVSKAHRYRANTPNCVTAGKTVPHCWEGGVDVPLPAGTPIYALAGGPLMGRGTFNMGQNGQYGYGVVTIQTPIGQVYYQHIKLAGGIPDCTNGNCGGYQVQTGQLLGYSTTAIPEVEIGVNSTWGGIWGTNTDNSLWLTDPRAALQGLAQGFFVMGGNQTGNTTDPCYCINQPVQGVTTGCDPGQYKPAGSTLCITCPCAGNTTSPLPGVPGLPNFASVLDFLDHLGAWILNPVRMLKLVIGVACLIIALFVIFEPGINPVTRMIAKK